MKKSKEEEMKIPDEVNEDVEDVRELNVDSEDEDDEEGDEVNKKNVKKVNEEEGVLATNSSTQTVEEVALWFFRAMLVLTHVCEEEYCRPFWSLRIIRICLYIAEFDSKLNGIGCIWYAVMPNGREIAVGAGSWRISAMGFKENSGYQNTCEFMGATMAVVGMIRYGLSGYPFACRGDSMAALTWADKKRYRGDLTVPAGFLFNYVWVMYQVMLAKGVHIPASKNQGCDDLTRECLEDVPALVKRAEEDMRKPVSERRYQ